MQTTDTPDRPEGRASNVDAILGRMKAALGVKNDVELSNAIGVSKSTISS